MFRSIISSIAGPSTSRSVRVLPVPRAPRSFSTTIPALKKRKAVEYDEDIDTSLEAEAEDSLFDVSTSSSSRGIAEDRATQRQRYKSSIMAIAALKGQQRKEAASAMRVGTLRKVVQLSDSPEELEELRGIVRGWRVLGGKVTGQTAKEIVGRCCNLGRPDLAREFSEERVQYGLPVVSERLQQKIQGALATYSPSTPTIQETA